MDVRKIFPRLNIESHRGNFDWIFGGQMKRKDAVFVLLSEVSMVCQQVKYHSGVKGGRWAL